MIESGLSLGQGRGRVREPGPRRSPVKATLKEIQSINQSRFREKSVYVGKLRTKGYPFVSIPASPPPSGKLRERDYIKELIVWLK